MAKSIILRRKDITAWVKDGGTKIDYAKKVGISYSALAAFLKSGKREAEVSPRRSPKKPAPKKTTPKKSRKRAAKKAAPKKSNGVTKNYEADTPQAPELVRAPIFMYADDAEALRDFCRRRHLDRVAEAELFGPIARETIKRIDDPLNHLRQKQEETEREAGRLVLYGDN